MSLYQLSVDGKWKYPDLRTPGGHRRYSLQRIEVEWLGSPKANDNEQNLTIAYARVSSHDQRLDLRRQEKRLIEHCKKNHWSFEVISDLGSGINYQKRGLIKLLRLLCQRKVKRLGLTHRDRLLRFGAPLLFKVCDYFDVEVVILEEQLTKDFEAELVACA